MGKFLETGELLKVTWGKVKELKGSITEIESVIKNLPAEKNTGPEGFITEFYQEFTELTPILLQLFQKHFLTHPMRLVCPVYPDKDTSMLYDDKCEKSSTEGLAKQSNSLPEGSRTALTTRDMPPRLTRKSPRQNPTPHHTIKGAHEESMAHTLRTKARGPSFTAAIHPK